MGRWTDKALELEAQASDAHARARANLAEIDKNRDFEIENGQNEALTKPANDRQNRQKSSEDRFWPVRIRWARERGWLNVRDPVTGEWHMIAAHDAPRGYARIATDAKYGIGI